MLLLDIFAFWVTFLDLLLLLVSSRPTTDVIVSHGRTILDFDLLEVFAYITCQQPVSVCIASYRYRTIP